MKSTTVLLAIALCLISNSAKADAGDPTPEQCLARFATDYVPEYNNPNDYILSTNPKAVSGALDVIKSHGFSDWYQTYAAMNLDKYTQAVGVVFNYMDETHLIIASINIEAGKCQVKEVADINTVDIEKNEDRTLFRKYFLGLPKSKLPKAVQDWVYDDVRNYLAGKNE